MFAKRSGYSLNVVQPEDFGIGLVPTPVAEVPRNTTSNNDNSLISFSVNSLRTSPASDERTDLINRLFQLQADVTAFLEETRTARLDDLAQRHDAAVANARLASKNFDAAKEAEFAAEAKWTGLDQQVKNRRKELQGANGTLAEYDRALLTRKDIASAEAIIEGMGEKLAKAVAVEDRAFSEYRSLVAVREDAATVYHEAVAAATELSKQIDAL